MHECARAVAMMLRQEMEFECSPGRRLALHCLAALTIPDPQLRCLLLHAGLPMTERRSIHRLSFAAHGSALVSRTEVRCTVHMIIPKRCDTCGALLQLVRKTVVETLGAGRELDLSPLRSHADVSAEEALHPRTLPASRATALRVVGHHN